MKDTWPILVRRARFALNASQYEMGVKLGVDQTVISRWENGRAMPGTKYQKQVRDILMQHDPALDPALIKLLPTTTAVVHYSNIASVAAISNVAASAYGMTADQAVATDLEKVLPDQILDVYAQITDSDPWRDGSALGYETMVLRGDGIWYKATGLVVGPAKKVVWNAAPYNSLVAPKCCDYRPRTPGSKIDLIRVLTKDDVAV